MAGKGMFAAVHDRRNIKHHNSQARSILHKTLMAQQTRQERKANSSMTLAQRKERREQTRRRKQAKQMAARSSGINELMQQVQERRQASNMSTGVARERLERVRASQRSRERPSPWVMKTSVSTERSTSKGSGAATPAGSSTISFAEWRAEEHKKQRQQQQQRRKPPAFATGTVVADGDVWKTLQAMRVGCRGPQSSYEPSIVFCPTENGSDRGGGSEENGDARWENDERAYRRSMERSRARSQEDLWSFEYPEEGDGLPQPVPAVDVPPSPSHLHVLRTDYIARRTAAGGGGGTRTRAPPRPRSAMARCVSSPAFAKVDCGTTAGSGMRAVRTRKRPQSAAPSRSGGSGAGAGAGTRTGGQRTPHARPSSASSIRDAYRLVREEVLNSPTKGCRMRRRRVEPKRKDFQNTVRGGWAQTPLDCVPYGHTLVSRQPGMDELQHAWTCGV